MLNEVVTTHFHDNNGTNDQHLLPGDGIANWEAIINRIKNAPRLLSVQCEVLQTPLMDNFGKSINSFAKVGFNL
jgi:sugar phosphate isomerase/epimerase